MDRPIPFRSCSLRLLSFVWLASCLLASPALANEPPVLVAPASAEGDPDQFVLFNVNSSDPDGDRVTLEAANLPTGASFRLDGNGNGSFLWRPTAADVGFYVVTLIATDNGVPVLRSTADVALTIGDPNLPPVLDPIGDQQATIGLTLVVPLSATDPEGDPLFFSTDPMLDGTLVHQGTDGTATFEYTPRVGAEGNQVLTIVVRDANGSDEETIVITVGEANVPPVLQPIGDRQAEVGARLEIELMAQDDDGKTLVFSAVGLPEGVSLSDRGDGTALLEGVPVAEGIYGVTVRVADDGVPSEAAEEQFEIDVQLPPPPLPDPPEVVITEASFTRGWLFVWGEGALPGSEVELRDPTTGASLGTVVANPDGAFIAILRPSTPPCSVVVHTGDQASAAVEVAGAPKSCSQVSAARVSLAVWKCRYGLLVVGHRAQPGATLRLYEPETMELLATTTANRHGMFALRSQAAERPDSVAVSVETNGSASMLGAIEVRGERRCAPKRDRFARHRHHQHHDHDRGAHGDDHRSCR